MTKRKLLSIALPILSSALLLSCAATAPFKPDRRVEIRSGGYFQDGKQIQENGLKDYLRSRSDTGPDIEKSDAYFLAGVALVPFGIGFTLAPLITLSSAHTLWWCGAIGLPILATSIVMPFLQRKAVNDAVRKYNDGISTETKAAWNSAVQISPTFITSVGADGKIAVGGALLLRIR